MITLICYPCFKNSFEQALLDPGMLAWEAALSITSLVIGIIGLTTLFPNYPAIAYSLIAIGSFSSFLALLRGGALLYLTMAFQKGNQEV